MTADPGSKLDPRRGLRNVLWPDLAQYESHMTEQERFAPPGMILGHGMMSGLTIAAFGLIAVCIVIFAGDSPLRYAFAALSAIPILAALPGFVMTVRLTYHFYLRPNRGA